MDTVLSASEEMPAAVSVILGMASEFQCTAGGDDVLNLDSRLFRDLGLDSLGQLELLRRLEQVFGIFLPEEVLRRVETLRDILNAFTLAEAKIASGMPLGDDRLSAIDECSSYTADRRYPSCRQSRDPAFFNREKLSRKGSVNKKIVSPLPALGAWLYTCYARLVFSISIVPLWICVFLTPGIARRRSLVRWTARLLFRLVGIALRVDGVENLCCSLQGQPSSSGALSVPLSHTLRIVVANHSSYLDGLVLTAVLPPEFSFVVKRELESSLLKGVFLRRLGTIFVERFDPVEAARGPGKVLSAMAKGESVAIFPEGTFRSSPGLLPFRMGAFIAAAKAGVPVIPVVIRGTREILCGDNIFLNRGYINVVVCAPIHPHGDDWSAALALRSAAQTDILRRCGEPEISAKEC